MERGDIWHVDLKPTKGNEQQGSRFVLIVSPKEFNLLGTTLCVPIMQGEVFARYAGFAATLSGAGTKTGGVVLSNQVRVLDLAARCGGIRRESPRGGQPGAAQLPDDRRPSGTAPRSSTARAATLLAR